MTYSLSVDRFMYRGGFIVRKSGEFYILEELFTDFHTIVTTSQSCIPVWSSYYTSCIKIRVKTLVNLV